MKVENGVFVWGTSGSVYAKTLNENMKEALYIIEYSDLQRVGVCDGECDGECAGQGVVLIFRAAGRETSDSRKISRRSVQNVARVEYGMPTHRNGNTKKWLEYQLQGRLKDGFFQEPNKQVKWRRSEKRQEASR